MSDVWPNRDLVRCFVSYPHTAIAVCVFYPRWLFLRPVDPAGGYRTGLGIRVISGLGLGLGLGV